MTQRRRAYRSRTLSPLRIPIAGLVCVVIGILVVGLIVIGLTSETTSARGYTAPYSAPAAPSQTRPVGVPAIHPHSSANGSAAAGTEPSPTFSVSDAVTYVKTHSIPRAVAVHGTLSVATAKFMSSKAASTTLKGESIGLPDDATVCYVELQGATVSFAGPGGTVVTFSRVYELFDAQSGNLLMDGGLD